MSYSFCTFLKEMHSIDSSKTFRDRKMIQFQYNLSEYLILNLLNFDFFKINLLNLDFKSTTVFIVILDVDSHDMFN